MGHLNGVYLKTSHTCNDRPVYRRHHAASGASYYIYYYNGIIKTWSIGKDKCGSAAFALNFSDDMEPPTFQWNTQWATNRLDVLCFP